MAEEGKQDYHQYKEYVVEPDETGAEKHVGTEVGVQRVIDDQVEKTTTDFINIKQDGSEKSLEWRLKQEAKAEKRAGKATTKLNRAQDNPDKQAKLLEKYELKDGKAEKDVVKAAEAILKEEAAKQTR